MQMTLDITQLYSIITTRMYLSFITMIYLNHVEPCSHRSASLQGVHSVDLDHNIFSKLVDKVE